MTIIRKTALGIGFGSAILLATAGSALAHDHLGTDPANPVYDANGPHSWANGGACLTTDEGYPDPAVTTQAGDCQEIQGMDSEVLGATAHVLAFIEIVDIENATADVNDSAHSYNGVAQAPDDSILGQGFDFPTQTPVGEVASDTIRLVVNTNTDWDAYAAVTTDFGNVNPVTGDSQVKPVDSFSVAGQNNGEAKVAFSALDEYVKITNNVPIDGANGDGSGTSGSGEASTEMIFYSGQAAVEAGDYAGAYTLAVMAAH